MGSDEERRMGMLAQQPGLAAAREAAHIARQVGTTRLRSFASLLACHQSRDVLIALLHELLADDGQLELMALLSQELILTTPPYGPVEPLAAGEEVSDLAPFAQWLREANHPLGALPAYRLPPEAHVGFPAHESRHAALAGSFAIARRARAVDPPARETEAPPIGRDVTMPAEAELIPTAVASWASRHEARVIRFPRDIAPRELGPRLLLSMQPACLFGASLADVRATPLAAEEVFAELFGDAAAGPAHGTPLYAAYARLAAWRSVHGLLGPTTRTGPDQIVGLAEEMRRASWLWFTARSAWFSQVADLGIAVLRPDGRTVALLAGEASD